MNNGKFGKVARRKVAAETESDEKYDGVAQNSFS